MDIRKSESGIKYELIRRSNMKTVRIRVKTDGSIVVSAPCSVELPFIEKVIESKSNWIKKAVNEAELRRNNKEEIKLYNGCKARIYGEIYYVKLIKSAGNYYEEQDNQLNLYAENDIAYENLLFGFIAEKSRKTLTDLFEFHFARFNKTVKTNTKPKIVLKLLKSKWGHCNYKKNEIMYNFLLAKLPPELCEYVVVHEIVHLAVPNHSDAFYKLGEKMLSGFIVRNKELKKFGTGLLEGIILN